MGVRGVRVEKNFFDPDPPGPPLGHSAHFDLAVFSHFGVKKLIFSKYLKNGEELKETPGDLFEGLGTPYPPA